MGVLLDQGIQVVRDARMHRRERDERDQAASESRFREIEDSMRRIENHVSGNTGLLTGILGGPLSERLERAAGDDDEER